MTQSHLKHHELEAFQAGGQACRIACHYTSLFNPFVDQKQGMTSCEFHAPQTSAQLESTSHADREMGRGTVLVEASLSRSAVPKHRITVAAWVLKAVHVSRYL